MMKKVLAIILSLALLSMVSVTAFAASSTIDHINGTASADVKGTYAAGSAATTVYRVDIAWGSMAFTYTDASQGTWNPENHQYDGAGTGTWSCAEDQNKITVINHSNAAVKAQFSYTPATGYSEINGTFSNETLNLATAVGTAVASAPSGSVTLSLTGALSSETAANTTIGSVTVTLEN